MPDTLFEGRTVQNNELTVQIENGNINIKLNKTHISLSLDEYCDVAGVLNAVRMLLESDEDERYAAEKFLSQRVAILANIRSLH